mgnify:CR=1 FL=1
MHTLYLTLYIPAHIGAGTCIRSVKSLQRRTIEWYHNQLCHPGATRTEETIRQHFTFPKLSEQVREFVSKCHICQVCKKTHKKYGLLPAKAAEAEPWEKLCVDLVGPYTIPAKEGKDLQLHCVTMIDPATGWFEMRELPNKNAITVANIVEQAWLTRYPWPTEITYDKGTEFMGEFATMITNDYGIAKRGATVRNPQANSIIERIHQTIGNIIRTFELYNTELDDKDPFGGLINAAMFATRATYHTTLKATPMQIVFGRDAILNLKFQSDWKKIKVQKERMIKANNTRENSKRIAHQYQVHNKVLLRRDNKAKYTRAPYEGPYIIAEVFTNGTVTIKKGPVLQRVNIRLIKPYNS